MNTEKKEYIHNWIFRAREDISVIENLEKSGIEYYSSTICFHAQQAVEKYLKAFLIYHDVDFPRTHDVDFLLLMCQKEDKDNFQFDFKSLTEFGVSVRYPDDFYIPGVSETKEYIQISKDVRDLVEKLLQKEIN
jgi:HEPN domain-containing protein